MWSDWTRRRKILCFVVAGSWSSAPPSPGPSPGRSRPTLGSPVPTGWTTGAWRSSRRGRARPCACASPTAATACRSSPSGSRRDFRYEAGTGWSERQPVTAEVTFAVDGGEPGQDGARVEGFELVDRPARSADRSAIAPPGGSTCRRPCSRSRAATSGCAPSWCCRLRRDPTRRSSWSTARSPTAGSTSTPGPISSPPTASPPWCSTSGAPAARTAPTPRTSTSWRGTWSRRSTRCASARRSTRPGSTSRAAARGAGSRRSPPPRTAGSRAC